MQQRLEPLGLGKPRMSWQPFPSGKKQNQKDLDSRGIEPRTTPMLREYYTTKPQAQLIGSGMPKVIENFMQLS
ncbi:hypothetical protein VN97_g8612 [Penicillium thymicola]|uniref:Uncharacterized protein n=1 Tax=Penicillium thymicola TaxID=293382 RepID=A0AAI9X5T0_PENTH|nr:hypothetical protein VN97_g8612 [Penicillium thymicola]